MTGLLRHEDFTALIPSLARDLGSVKAALILQFLFFRCDKAGTTTATLDEIAAGIGCSRRTVQMHLVVLHEDGVISSRRTSFSDATKTYRIHPEKIATLEVATLAPHVAEPATLDVAEPATSLFTKEKKNSIPQRGVSDLAFDEWYDLYPRKVAKGRARTAYKAAMRKAEPAVILAALRQQLPGLIAKPEGFRPYPATWLNGESWLDEAAPAETDAVWQHHLRFQDA